jgi:hypothetical protein
MLVDGDGVPMLDRRDREIVEGAFEKAPWILSVLSSNEEDAATAATATERDLSPELQVGGDGLLGKAGNVGLPGNVGKVALPGKADQSQQTEADISLDQMVEWIIEKTAAADTYMKKVKEGNPINRMMNTPIPVFPAVTFRPVVTFLIQLIDLIRLFAATSGVKSTPLTLLVLIEEFIEGKWRQMILTSLGFLSPSGVAAGVLLKIMVNVWLLGEEQQRTDFFRKSMGLVKSTLSGFILWMGNLLIPPLLKAELLGAISSVLDPTIRKLQPTLEKLKAKKDALLKEKGLQVDYSGRMDVEGMKELTQGDLQKLQSLTRFTPLTCSAEGQRVIQVIQKVPYMNLILELLNIPTTVQGKEALCKTTLGQPLPKVLSIELQNPDVIPLVSQGEGSAPPPKNSKESPLTPPQPVYGETPGTP